MISFLKNAFFCILAFAMALSIRTDIQYDYPFKMGDFLGHTTGKIQQEAINGVKKAFNISDADWEQDFSFIKRIEKNIKLMLSEKRTEYNRDNDLKPETIAMIEKMLIKIGIEPSAVDIESAQNSDAIAYADAVRCIGINQTKFDVLTQEQQEAVIAHEIGHLINGHYSLRYDFDKKLILLFSKEKRAMIENQYDQIVQNPEHIKEIIPNASDDFYKDALSEVEGIQRNQEDSDSFMRGIYERGLRELLCTFYMTEEQKLAIQYFQTTNHEFIADQYLASHDPVIFGKMKKFREKLSFIEFPPNEVDRIDDPGYPTNTESQQSLEKNLISKQKYLYFLSRLYDNFAPTNTIEYAGTYIPKVDTVVIPQKIEQQNNKITQIIKQKQLELKMQPLPDIKKVATEDQTLPPVDTSSEKTESFYTLISSFLNQKPFFGIMKGVLPLIVSLGVIVSALSYCKEFYTAYKTKKERVVQTDRSLKVDHSVFTAQQN